MRLPRRWTALGMGLGAAPGLAFAAWAAAQNPWFLDRPWLYLLALVLAPGAVVGLALGRLSRAPLGREGLLLLALVQVGLLAFLRPLPPPPPVRLFVMGVDGATFDLIDPLVAAGELPAFAALEARGGRATLTSMEPMFSPLLWTTMATGRPPEVHGIRGFATRAEDLRVPRFWDVAEAAGLRVGLYKWLVTYPPRPVQGFMVPAWLAPGPDTWPPELSFVKELELSNRTRRAQVAARRPGWRLALAGVPHGLRFGTLVEALRWRVRERLERPGDDARFHALQLLRVRMDRDVFIHALHAEGVQLATFTTYATDALAHRFWDAREPLLDAYRQADAVLGEIVSCLPEDAVVVVLSDHGFRAFDPRSDLPPFQPLTERLSQRIAESVSDIHVVRLGHKLTVTVSNVEDLPALEAALGGLVDAEGRPVYRWEPLPDAPASLGLTLVDERVSAARLATGRVGGEPLSDYVRLAEAFEGEHDARGVFLVAGPGLPEGERLDDLALLDVAPTLLALLGVPPPRDWPGRVAAGPSARGADSVDHLLPEAGSGAEGVDVEMLRSLGYVE